jgi:hypothetical protein
VLTIFTVKRSLPFRHNHLENGAMNSATIGCVFLQTYRAAVWNHTLHMAVALSYYLALSLFPRDDPVVGDCGLLASAESS